jgi:hypothetical protein
VFDGGDGYGEVTRWARVLKQARWTSRKKGPPRAALQCRGAATRMGAARDVRRGTKAATGPADCLMAIGGSAPYTLLFDVLPILARIAKATIKRAEGRRPIRRARFCYGTAIFPSGAR